LQDERYNSLDETLRTSIKPLLQELVATHKKLTTALLGKHTISRHANHRTTNDHANNAQNSHTDLLDVEKKSNLALLDALKFPTMSHRHVEIAEAHQGTFSWIFAEPRSVDSGSGNRARPWSSYVQWLLEGSGIYWINGKAGSGKSTLMRYISGHPHTRQSLSHWSPNADLQVASFYFWNSGTSLLRKQAGLLRSLLYGILHRRSDLIRPVFAPEWESISSAAANKSLRIPEIEFSLPRLEEAFISLSDLASEELRFCFFVDGLDEYDGDPEMLIKIFTIISKSPFVKVCLSSRPWLVFDEAFEGCPNLRLQDLTWSDIRHYVDDKLDTNLRMETLKKSNAAAASFLVRTIVNKANGVFLWVYIVTRSVLEGLRNHDSIADLQRRLDMLPSDLDALYNHIIRHMNPLYIEQASRIFQIYGAFMGINYSPTILELELAVTANYSSAMAHPSRMTQLEIEDRCQRMAVHLKSRCEGLLEIHDFHDRHWESVADTASIGDTSLSPKEVSDDLSCNEQETDVEKRLKINSKVSYLHRTVKDFLETDVHRSRFHQSISLDKGFDPNLPVLMSYVLNLKRSLRTINFSMAADENNRIKNTTRELIIIVQKIDGKNDQYADLLHEFFEQTCHWWANPSSHLRFAAPPYAQWRAEFFSLATWSGLWKYIDKSLGTIEDSLRSSIATCLLLYALGLDRPHPHQAMSTYFYHALEMRRTEPKMVRVILEHHGDPNGLYEVDHTIWQCFLHQIVKEMTPPPSNHQLATYFRFLEALLQHSAAPAPCDERSKCPVYRTFDLSLSLESVIDRVFSLKFPAEADSLYATMRGKGSKRSRKHRSESPDIEGSKRRRRSGINPTKSNARGSARSSDRRRVS
jgi:hypothetical protein